MSQDSFRELAKAQVWETRYFHALPLLTLHSSLMIYVMLTFWCISSMFRGGQTKRERIPWGTTRLAWVLSSCLTLGYRLALRRDPRLDLQQHLQKMERDHPQVQHVLQQREAQRPCGALAAAALRLRHDALAECRDRPLLEPERASGPEQLERR